MTTEPQLPEDAQSADPTGVYFFQGKKLPFPLSFEREVAAAQLGRRRASIVNDLLFIYLCTRSEDDIEAALWSPSTEAKLRREMYIWFQALGGSIRDGIDPELGAPDTRSPAGKEITALANRMWADLAKRAFTPDVKSEGAANPNITG